MSDIYDLAYRSGYRQAEFEAEMRQRAENRRRWKRTVIDILLTTAIMLSGLYAGVTAGARICMEDAAACEKLAR